MKAPDLAPVPAGRVAAALDSARQHLARREWTAATAVLADPAIAGAPALVSLRAQAEWGCGRYDAALASFSAAAEKPSASAEDLVRYAQALAAMGDSERAEVVLASDARHGRSVHVEFLRALFSLDRESLSSVRERFEALAREVPQAGELVIAACALRVFDHVDAAAPRDFGRESANVRWQAVLDRAPHVPPARVYGTASAVLRAALAARTLDGATLELGVFHGRSLRQIAALTPGPVHGFDSFEGLPEDWTANDPRGSYSTGGSLPEMPPRVTLHRGWFADTLPAFAAQQTMPIALAHIDCDLYSSAHTALEALARLIVPGSILVFDDYFMADDAAGERRAWQEFVAQRGLCYEYLAFALLGREAALRVTGFR